jgi:integrase/recombinase XerD
MDGLAFWAEEYLRDCELRLHSPHTIATRRVFIRNLLWFLRHKGYAMCDAMALRQFLFYLAHGHEEPGGRFGKASLTRAARPVTIKDYYRCLRVLFGWLAVQGVIRETPFLRIAAPLVREEVKAPLSLNQIETLLQSARRSQEPLRNEAILLFLLDTGCRAGELVAIKLRDLDLPNGRCRILGKGGKYRTLYFGARVSQTLSAYLSHYLADNREFGKADTGKDDYRADQQRGAIGDWPLFYSGRLPANWPLGADCPGGSFPSPFLPLPPFTRWGLLRLIKRLGAMAGIKDACCVHALRRTFAVQMLRNGANVFSVQALLGHTDLQQTRQYCAIALTDAEEQHHAFSPADRLAH